MTFFIMLLIQAANASAITTGPMTFGAALAILATWLGIIVGYVNLSNGLANLKRQQKADSDARVGEMIQLLLNDPKYSGAFERLFHSYLTGTEGKGAIRGERLEYLQSDQGASMMKRMAAPLIADCIRQHDEAPNSHGSQLRAMMSSIIASEGASKQFAMESIAAHDRDEGAHVVAFKDVPSLDQFNSGMQSIRESFMVVNQQLTELRSQKTVDDRAHREELQNMGKELRADIRSLKKIIFLSASGRRDEVMKMGAEELLGD